MLNRAHGPALRAMRTERTESLEWVNDRNLMSEFGDALSLYFGGDMNAALALTGQVMGRIDEIKPVAEIVAECAEEFFTVLSGLADRYLDGSGPVAS